MPSLKPNARVIASAVGGPRLSYSIDGHPGLGLAVRGDGNASWTIRYRVGGKQREHVLHNDARNADFQKIVTAKADWLASVKVHGVDPKAEREAQTKAKAEAERAQKLLLSTVMDEWIALPRERALRPRTVKLYRWIFNTYVVPDFGDRPIAEITKAELKTHFDVLRDRLIKSGGRDGLGTRGEMAGKAHTYLTAVFGHAVAQEYLMRSPMLGLPRPVPKEAAEKSSRPLRPGELRNVWHGAGAHLSPAFARMIKLALLLGRRRAEISESERGELHLDGDEPHWLIKPREGNKSALPSLVPLPRQAADIFRSAVCDAGDSAYVFPQSRGIDDKPTSPDSMSHAWRDLGRAVGVPQEVTLHSARGLVTDTLEVMGVPDNIVSHILHHTSDMRSTTAKRVYSSNSFRSEKLRALRLWELRLRNIASGRRLHVLRWHS